MHFWIDKRSQGCGFSGRRLVTSGYGLNNHRSPACAFVHPKPMVTPVHRFQSIESVANNGLRINRGCSRAHWNQWQCRAQPPSVHFNGSTSNIRSPEPCIRPLSHMVTTGPSYPTRRNRTSTSAKFKCGVWVFFVVVTLFLAGIKYYIHGVSIGMEAFAFCSLLFVLLIIGGLVNLYEAITATANNPESTITITDNISEEDVRQVPTPLPPPTNSEMSPPPYNIAIMLPAHNDETIQGIRDSPPPSYEKAVN